MAAKGQGEIQGHFAGIKTKGLQAFQCSVDTHATQQANRDQVAGAVKSASRSRVGR